ncbi:MAG: TonB-dependent receptor [Gammaproteobacteria bacterium]|nr:TonB-dependent receptor [Gammaproteobacteria bacterium]
MKLKTHPEYSSIFGKLIPQLLAWLLACLLLVSLGANAQTEETDDTASDEIEEITVIGTAIAGSAIDAPYAVTSLYRENLEDQGSPLLVDLFKNLGASLGVLGERQGWYNHAQANIVPESVTSVNLRGLGPSRTLVLLNGQRHVYLPAQIFGGRFVDVNNFPSIALENVQVMKEGAAAIYGSDAIAGVVDFRTRSGFEGMQFSINIDQFADAGDMTLSAIWGREFETGHLVASFERAQRSALPPTSRDYVVRPFSGDGGWSFWGNPGAFIVPSEPVPTDIEGFITTLQGLPHFVDPECENFGGHLELFPNYPEFNTCRFRYAQFDNIIDEMNHNRLFVEGNGTLENGLDWHVEMLWAYADIPNWLTTPSYPPRSQFDGVQLVATDHPGRISFCETYGDIISECSNTEDWYFYGRLLGNVGGGRIFERNSETFRIAGALEGVIDVDQFFANYDVAVSFSSSDGHMETGGEYGYRKFLAFRGFGGPDCGVGVVADPTSPSYIGLGSIPAGVEAGEGNCHYYNPFSVALPNAEQWGSLYSRQPNPNFDPAVANDRSMLDWILETVTQESTALLFVIDSSLSGEIIPERLEYAVGYQFRAFKVDSVGNRPADLSRNPCYVPDDRGCASTPGLFSFTVGTFPYDSEQSVNRIFAELASNPHDKVKIQFAIDYEEYGVAHSLDPKVAVRFNISETFSVRSSLQSTFRVPSVDDLNTQPLTTLEYVAEADIYKPVDTYGSEDLDPESAITYNIGIVGRASDWEISADYWSYDFKDLIGPIPHAAISRLYVDDATRSLVQSHIGCPGNFHPCSGVSIERIRVDLVNWPGIETTGIDFHASKYWNTEYGEVSFSWEGTRVNTYTVQPLIAFGETIIEETEGAGFLNQPNPIAPPIPQLKMRVSAALDRDQLRIVSYLNYISSYEDRTEAGSQWNEIDSQMTLDVMARWQPRIEGLDLSFGILNVLDEDPPFVNWEQGYDGFTHNPKNRRLKMVVSYTLPN